MIHCNRPIHIDRVSLFLQLLLVFRISQLPTPSFGSSLSQHSILRSLYDATDGENWRNNTGWEENDAGEICTRWYGVTCDENGDVSKLIFGQNGMLGAVPKEVFNLTALSELAFRQNPDLVLSSFEGIEFAGNLRHLTFENSGVKSFDGIGMATKLSSLDISEHGDGLVTEIPNELFQLVNLKRLWLDKNGLYGSIPYSIESLVNLEEIDLHGNDLSHSIPTQIGALTNLQDLSMGDNNLTGSIPTDIENLTKLQGVWLYKNSLSGSLPPFANMPDLSDIQLYYNSFEGSIADNFLEQTNTDLSSLTIRISHNKFSGKIPSELSRFTKMTFHAEDNRFTEISGALCDNVKWNDGWVEYYECDAILCPKGTFNDIGRREKYKPCSECNSGGNDYLGSTKCNLGPSPSPPSSPAPHPGALLNGQKSILMELFDNLGGNDWKEHVGWGVDDNICSWSGIICGASGEGVTKINLKANNLVGELPPSIFTLPNLSELNLHLNDELSITENSLTNISSASKLTHLILAEISSLYVSGLKNASNLTYLDISGNKIAGLIPPIIFDLSNLKVLFIHDNDFSGTIPLELNNLTFLEDVDLSRNKLSGSLVTSYFSNLAKMGYLKLSDNFLTGPLADNMFENMPNLVQIHLDNNSFVGSIPSFSSISDLGDLDLSYNQLTGTIPSNFIGGQNDDALISIDVSHNFLAGTVPSLFGRFKHLEIDLKANHFDAFDQTLCSNTNWVGESGTCDSVLCPTGSWNKYGREMDGTPCEPCSYYSAIYLGSTRCEGDDDEELDRAVLEEFYYECQGSSWTNNYGWSSAQHICTWYGVDCTPGTSHTFDGTQAPMVNKIDLKFNNVKCSSSASYTIDQVFEMSSLRILNLHGNPGINFDFTKIPTLVANPLLEDLSLGKTGMVNAIGIENLKNLKTIDFSENDLKAIPDGVFQIQTLERFYFDQNKITGTLSSEIGLLFNLKSVDVFGNSIGGRIPSEIGLLQHLEDVELGHNPLADTIHTIENTFQNKPKLWGLFVSQTGITGRLESFDQYPGLIELNLSGNSITGTIPKDFLASVPSNRANLKVLLGENSLEGIIPSELGRLDSLFIDLKDNMISGISDELCSKHLWQMGDTQDYGCDAILCKPGTSSISGRSHDNLNGPATLCQDCTVSASHVPFYGATTCDPHESLFDLERKHLTDFYNNCGGKSWINNDNWLSDNSVCSWYGVTCHEEGLVDSIVLGNNNVKCKENSSKLSSLWNLARLSNLWLYSNPLGDFSFDGIGKAYNLTSLLLDSTGLTTVNGIGEATNLRELDLRFNSIVGPFPNEIFSLIHLHDLYLTSNRLTGVLPTSFSSLGKLRKLRLDINSFEGTLPDFAGLQNLSWLDLSSNNLTGTIPSEWLPDVSFIKQTSLEKVTIDLSDNQLTGEVPVGLSHFDYLDIYLKGNKISTIDSHLCEKDNWNEGVVAYHGCNAILCPVGTYNSQGRQTSNNNPCISCSKVRYMGSETCSSAYGFSHKAWTSIVLVTSVIWFVF